MIHDDDNRFADLLDIHGSELGRWPDAAAAQQVRAAALRDPAFRKIVDAAKRRDAELQALSDAIDADIVTPRTGQFEAAILKTIEPQAERRRLFSGPSLRRLAAGALIACAFGVGMGEWAPMPIEPEIEAHDQLLMGIPETGTAQS